MFNGSAIDDRRNELISNRNFRLLGLKAPALGIDVSFVTPSDFVFRHFGKNHIYLKEPKERNSNLKSISFFLGVSERQLARNSIFERYPGRPPGQISTQSKAGRALETKEAYLSSNEGSGSSSPKKNLAKNEISGPTQWLITPVASTIPSLSEHFRQEKEFNICFLGEARRNGSSI